MLPYFENIAELPAQQLRKSLIYWIQLETRYSTDICELSTKLRMLRDSLVNIEQNIKQLETELEKRESQA